jgi:hypothetical protein
VEFIEDMVYYQPAWVTYLSSLNKEECLEIAEFLEEQLGTKETPLNVYDGKNYSKSTKVYGVSPDDLKFVHFNYQDSKKWWFLDKICWDMVSFKIQIWS